MAPIPEVMPVAHNQTVEIPDIGQPSLACMFTMSRFDPTNWYNPHLFPTLSFIHLLTTPKRWVFEKFDGVRGFWNPLKKTFYSRKGNVFTLPKEVIDAMPDDLFLDGELWYHRFLLPIYIIGKIFTYSHQPKKKVWER